MLIALIKVSNIVLARHIFAPIYCLLEFKSKEIVKSMNNEDDVKLVGGGGEYYSPQQTPTTLLDSKLISATKLKLYSIKLVECGDYIQVYLYKESKSKKEKVEKDFDLKLSKLETQDLVVEDTITTSNQIEERNIIRSKLECQRLAKSNIKDWETFITLTFEDNITSVKDANKRFKYFIDKVRRVKKDFKYLCIPEFQKRGAVHYHLLTNISINDTTLIYAQENNKKFKHIKYWDEGFTSVEVMKGNPKKVVGYISKYMTKDIDNRLFGKHRYFYSQNLIRPKQNFINLENDTDKEFYNKKIQDVTLIYQNEYINSYDNNKVTFLEFIK